MTTRWTQRVTAMDIVMNWHLRPGADPSSPRRSWRNSDDGAATGFGPNCDRSFSGEEAMDRG